MVGRGTPVDFDVDHRLVDTLTVGTAIRQGQQHAIVAPPDFHDRVDDEVQGQPLAVHFHGDRVDQEGHVVVDDLDDRMRRLPAVLFGPRVVHPQAGRTGTIAARKMQLRQCRPVEIGHSPLGQIFRRHLAVEAPDEGLDQRRFGHRQPLAHHFQNRSQQLRLALFRDLRHTASCLSDPLTGEKTRATPACDASIVGQSAARANEARQSGTEKSHHFLV